MVSGDCTSYGGASAPIKLTLTHSRSYNQQLKQQHLPISSEILPSSEQIAGSEGLLTEILLRLPPKTLLRFQCVSKHWLSLISSTYFRRLHTRRNATSSASTVGVFLCRHPNYDFLSLHEERLAAMGRIYDRLSDARDGKVLSNISSCNGLVCLGFKSDDAKTEFYVYNLTTGHHRFIPVPDGMVVKSMNLAFDPKRSGDYDVVCVWLSVSENQLRFSVYSSACGVWRHSTEYCNGNVELCCYRGVYWKGAIHWFSQTGPFLCFETDSIEFKSMPSTQIPEGQWYRNIEYFGESGGHLHLIEIHKPQDIEFDVLELKSDYSQWFVKYRVNLEFLTILYPAMVNQEMYPPEDYNFPYAFTVLCFLADEENNARLLISIPGKIILYEMQNGSVKELADIKPDYFRLFIGGARYDCFDAYTHVETLAFV
ncbi:F-box protein At5g07610-like [Nicotiana tabacum]|uniref:F-box protein At5g07610-like n=2 Tax=Nicotiana TaxID=4085 RepID=A0A1S3ZTM6_TOBAC|nr:PREDICTED: F-box protein At5g07610-like [Nicotiana sylvestris]XP_016467722.1 PREDICTED: F-box protein At5g07610-like [Nicotiana tabacum]